MAFSFSLQALLNWKINLEEQSQLRLAEIRRRMTLLQKEIETLARKRKAEEENLKEKSRSGIAGAEYLLYRNFSEGARRDLLSLEEKKMSIAREMRAEREQLIALMKEKKILEKIKEKQFRKYLSDMEKSEQKRNDEIATMKHHANAARKPA